MLTCINRHTKVLIVVVVLLLMQKVRLQIMLDSETLNQLHSFMIENQIINESKAIVTLFRRVRNYQAIISSLEAKAHQAEEWKKRAQAHIEQTVVKNATSLT